MSDSLHETFGQMGAPKPTGGLTHPHENEILTGAKATLSRIPFGRDLLEFANQQNVPITVISSREIDFSVLNATQVVLYATPGTPKDFHLLSMALACGIRQVEHKYLGLPGDGSLPKTPEEASIFLSKNIDNVMTMCQIADEYSSVDQYSKLIDVVQKLGYVEEYKAYKSGKGFEGISQIMIKRANEYSVLVKKEG